MDTLTFLIVMVIMMFAIQNQQNWIVFGVLAVIILTMRSIATTITLIITVVVVYFVTASGLLFQYWPIVGFGLLIVAMLLGAEGEGGGGADMYSPGMGGYADLLGGGGGYSGGGGYG